MLKVIDIHVEIWNPFVALVQNVVTELNEHKWRNNIYKKHRKRKLEAMKK